MGTELTVRREEGDTPVLKDWGSNCEYGVMRDVLLGPPETFRSIDNSQFSSVVRDTERKGKALDTQLAQRQHRELVAAYEDAGVTVHFLPPDEETGYQKNNLKV